MQFIANGPDIPDALLQAHEEGRVVFFCGAGISCPAGLPGFKTLVETIYELTGTTMEQPEKDAFSRFQYDAVLDQLERRLPGRRRAMRAVLREALKPGLRRKGAVDTHMALIRLARDREGEVRLVTTNFDRLFLRAAKRMKLKLNTYAAPMLPVPKRSRWNGVVHLHGLLPEQEDESALNSMVLTSGDFGLAYLAERWAARFASELFRHYVVCFIGYGINDPVLRYMMDALAADRMLGEEMPQAYAFGGCPPGQEIEKTKEWKAKGVEPVLYGISAEDRDHSALHRTLKIWSETYRDGILGKEQIVTGLAMARPSSGTREDDFVGRLIWALSDESGLPAKRFAEFNPAPPLEWLQAFSARRYRQEDLERFGIIPRMNKDEKIEFSLLNRPAPHTCAPWMALVAGEPSGSRWDRVMYQLARWLVRHLNNPELILWLSRQGGRLHDSWARMIEDGLAELSRLEREGKTEELTDIRMNAPDAIPGPAMQRLWRLFLSGRVKSPGSGRNFQRWHERLERDGPTASLRLELRELLAPKIVLKKSFRWSEDVERTDASRSLKNIIDWELVLEAGQVDSSVRNLMTDPRWHAACPVLLNDFQQLLRDSLDLLGELGEANERSDGSCLRLPSIGPHPQNSQSRYWTELIELLRDAWQVVRETDPGRASRMAGEWFGLSYPSFKRLALFAASQEGCIAPEQWVEWLLADGSWWLWSSETHREIMRLLVLQGTRLAPEEGAKLESAILQGPPRGMYEKDLAPEDWRLCLNQAVWLRLAKLQAGGANLGREAGRRLDGLPAANSGWELAEDESDEFTSWIGSTTGWICSGSKESRKVPRKRKELVVWLKEQYRSPSRFHRFAWSGICRTRFFHCFLALRDLAGEDFWPAEFWQDALQAWSEEGSVERSWRFAAPLILTMSDALMREIAPELACWLEVVSKSIGGHEDILLTLCRRLLGLPLQGGLETGEPVTEALNHPVGQITNALLNQWLKQAPGDNCPLPENLQQLFTRLCSKEMEQFRHGRVMLASQLIALYRADGSWTETRLLPFFDWDADPAEAQAVWEGYLRSSRLSGPLLIAFKDHFLATARHYSRLIEFGPQYAALLTLAALDPVEGCTRQDFQAAFRALPGEGLCESARMLVQALQGAGTHREEYWKNRIVPFWRQVWPKSLHLVSPKLTEPLVHLCIAAGGEYPSAVKAVQDWLRPVEHLHRILHGLPGTGLAGRFPEETLSLLDAVINDQSVPPPELRQSLDAIALAAPHLKSDPRYHRLSEHCRRYGI